MKEKILTILTLIFIAMSISGFTYAQWNDIIIVSNTMQIGNLNMGFVQPLTCTDNEATKNVGECDCQYADLDIDVDTGKASYKTLIITMTNAYPSYEIYCNFTIENTGLLKLHIKDLIISDPTNTLTWDPTKNALVDIDGNPIIDIIIKPDLVCKYLWPNDDPLTPETEPVKLEAQIDIHIAQDAQESTIYYFEVQIEYEVA